MASGFTQFMSKWKPPSFFFKEPFFNFHQKNLETRTRGVYLNELILNKEEANTVQKIIDKQGTSALHYMDMVNLMLQRPRILKFNDLDFGLLENIELTIAAEDYAQPFETTILELPKEYRQTRSVTDPWFGIPQPEYAVPVERKPTMHPMFVSTTWRKELEMLSVCIFLSSSDIYTCMIGDRGHTLEEQLHGTKNTFLKSLPVVEAEKELYHRIIRASLNANLFATTVPLGMSPENMTYYQKLYRSIKRKGDRSWELFKIHPFIYEPLESVVSKTGDFAHKTEGGWTVRPHWRRAHWRTQRFGPGLTEKKTILIQAVFVNKELL